MRSALQYIRWLFIPCVPIIIINNIIKRAELSQRKWTIGADIPWTKRMIYIRAFYANRNELSG